MRALMGLVAIAQGTIVGVWIYQTTTDRQRPPDQQWVPRHWPPFGCLQGAVTVATFVVGSRLGD